ncbi:hypothetical protein MKW98_023586 [Papaver atlanticum]|uniref:Uncharacterized protein n=1 Tax=Papaver atlanticum TaxID=357466 RepID=A0AAD4SZ78_9MAGN|nr:hypothetical protein MKW98_023586 [Papaver atlanticum]
MVCDYREEKWEEFFIRNPTQQQDAILWSCCHQDAILVAFGLLGRDPFVAVPNGFGCGLGAPQLILCAFHRIPKANMVVLLPVMGPV